MKRVCADTLTRKPATIWQEGAEISNRSKQLAQGYRQPACKAMQPPRSPGNADASLAPSRS
jgi:hypothetical protein